MYSTIAREAHLRQATLGTMKTIRKLVQSDSNANVRIDVPVSGSLRQFEVVVVWQEVATDAMPYTSQSPEGPSSEGWPEGWLEQTSGSIDDPSFTRQPQGTLEERESL
jgi:hypothetical protein